MVDAALEHLRPPRRPRHQRRHQPAADVPQDHRRRTSARCWTINVVGTVLVAAAAARRDARRPATAASSWSPPPPGCTASPPCRRTPPARARSSRSAATVAVEGAPQGVLTNVAAALRHHPDDRGRAWTRATPTRMRSELVAPVVGALVDPAAHAQRPGRRGRRLTALRAADAVERGTVALPDGAARPGRPRSACSPTSRAGDPHTFAHAQDAFQDLAADLTASADPHEEDRCLTSPGATSPSTCVVTAAAVVVFIGGVMAVLDRDQEPLHHRHLLGSRRSSSIAAVSYLVSAGSDGDDTRRLVVLAADRRSGGCGSALYIGSRNRGHGEDPRYTALMRHQTGNLVVFLVRKIYGLQGVLDRGRVAPASRSRCTSRASLGVLGVIAIVVWAVGFALRGGRRLAALPLQGRPGQRRQDHGPRPVGLDPAPELLRRRRASGSPCGCSRSATRIGVLTVVSPIVDDPAAAVLQRQGAHREGHAAQQRRRVRRLRRAHERLLPAPPRSWRRADTRVSTRPRSGDLDLEQVGDVDLASAHRDADPAAPAVRRAAGRRSRSSPPRAAPGPTGRCTRCTRRSCAAAPSASPSATTSTELTRGRSRATRQVDARQGDRLLCRSLVSAAVVPAPDGLSHARPAPVVAARRGRRTAGRARRGRRRARRVLGGLRRHRGPGPPAPAPVHSAAPRHWMRVDRCPTTRPSTGRRWPTPATSCCSARPATCTGSRSGHERTPGRGLVGRLARPHAVVRQPTCAPTTGCSSSTPPPWPTPPARSSRPPSRTAPDDPSPRSRRRR